MINKSNQKSKLNFKNVGTSVVPKGGLARFCRLHKTYKYLCCNKRTNDFCFKFLVKVNGNKIERTDKRTNERTNGRQTNL
jgi:hypothetical protein